IQSRPEFKGELGDRLEEAGVVMTDEDALQIADLTQADSDDGRQAARIPPSGIPAPRRSKTTKGDESSKINEPSDVGRGAFDLDESSPQRTVEEMMATASVKRVETAESPVEKGEKGGKSKLGRLVKNISRALSNYKLPSTEMLTPPAPRSEMAEAELMDRPRRVAE